MSNSQVRKAEERILLDLVNVSVIKSILRLRLPRSFSGTLNIVTRVVSSINAVTGLQRLSFYAVTVSMANSEAVTRRGGLFAVLNSVRVVYHFGAVGVDYANLS